MPESAIRATPRAARPSLARCCARLALAACLPGMVGFAAPSLQAVAADEPCASAPAGNARFACLFDVGMRAKREGRYRAAIRAFRHMLADDPSLGRVRLELAHSYYLIGNDDQAEHHFRYVLGGDVPPQVAANVRRLLNAIERRSLFAWSFDFSISPQTNVNNATHRRTITVGGVPWTLSNDSRKRSGLKADGSLRVQARPFVNDNLRAHFAAQLQAGMVALADGDLSVSTLGDLDVHQSYILPTGELGVAFTGDLREVAIGASLSRMWVKGDAYHTSIGGWLRGWYQADRYTRLSANLALDRLLYTSSAAMKDAWQLSITPAVQRQLSPIFMLQASLPFSARAGGDRDRDYISTGARLSATWLLPHDFTFNLAGGLARRWHDAPDRTFAIERRDWQYNASARLTWGGITFLDMAPYVELRYSRRDSNIVLHDYENVAALLGLSARF